MRSPVCVLPSFSQRRNHIPVLLMQHISRQRDSSCNEVLLFLSRKRSEPEKQDRASMGQRKLVGMDFKRYGHANCSILAGRPRPLSCEWSNATTAAGPSARDQLAVPVVAIVRGPNSQSWT